MKMNWRTYRVALLIVAALAWVSSPMHADSGAAAPVVRVSANVAAHAVRIEAKASGSFEYTTYRPSANLFIADFAGVTPAAPQTAQVLKSAVVSSYRVLPYRTGEKPIVRLEVVLRTPVEPRVARENAQQLTLTFRAAETPATTAPVKEAPVVQPAAQASSIALIQGIHVSRADQQTQVRVDGSARLTYQAARLKDPDRLVLDFAGARLRLSQKRIPSELEPVRAVRYSQFRPDAVRVVIDLSRQIPYSVGAHGNSVVVAFGAEGSANTKSAEPQPVAAAQAEENQTKDTEGVAPAPAPSAAAASPAAEIPIQDVSLPETLTQATKVLASPAQVKVDPEPAPPAVAAPAQSGPAAPAPAAQEKGKYSGEPISVNLKDVDLKDFFRLVHEISGLNVVLDPNVKGSLTIVLDDVPWDQALDIVMRNNNLDKQLEGNVLRVATRDTLKKEAEAQRDLAKAQAEAVPQVTATRVLSYAKASGVRDTLKRFLSSRGDILADERSNTLIIRDIPSVLPDVDNLIRQLDRKSQQVEIEARVVSATRTFSREIGTQFGFATSLTGTGGHTVLGGILGNSSFISPVVRGPSLPTPPLVVSTGSSGGTSGNQIPLNTALGSATPTSGITLAHAEPNLALDFIISAAESRGVGKLLSKPKIVTQNNEKAVVKQGTKIPITTTINNTISTQFIDAVLKLEVTPQITAEGTIFMDVVVENTQIDAGIPRVQGIPALDTQAAETKVLVNDGGTVVIGGVILSQQRTDVAQVPLFGSIPLIGHLFKRTTVSTSSQELLFFITPRIVPS